MLEPVCFVFYLVEIVFSELTKAAKEFLVGDLGDYNSYLKVYSLLV